MSFFCKITLFVRNYHKLKGKICVGRRFVVLLYSMEQMLDKNGLQQWHSLVDNAERIVLVCHVNPDGDALGSILALKSWLSRQGKQVTAITPNGFPDFLLAIPGATEILVYDKHQAEAESLIYSAQLLFVCDLNDPSRLAGMTDCILASSAPRILLDHHLSPVDFCQLVISHPEMSATCEVICHLLHQLGVIDGMLQYEASCLYIGLMTDTGAFTYNSNRPEIFECVSYLLARGIDKDSLYRKMFWNYSADRLRLMGYLLYVKMEVIPDLNASIMTLTADEYRLFHGKNGDTEGFVNIPLQIRGARLSAFLREDTERHGEIRVSLRSVGDVPCNELCAKYFNGGGHKNASGGSFKGTLEEAVATLKRGLEEMPQLK